MVGTGCCIVVGALLLAVGCLAISLASTHQLSEALPIVKTENCLQTLPNGSGAFALGKELLLELYALLETKAAKISLETINSVQRAGRRRDQRRYEKVGVYHLNYLNTLYLIFRTRRQKC